MYLIFLLSGEIERADEYISVYCDKTQTPLDDIQKWIPRVAAAQLVKANTETKQKLYELIDAYGE